MTKAARIIAMKKDGVDNGVIATTIGVTREYVRACWLRHTRPEKHRKPYDVARMVRYRADEKFRERCLATARRYKARKRAEQNVERTAAVQPA